MLWFKHGLANAVVLLSTLLHSTAAVECAGSGLYTVTTVNRQEDLDSLVANCTVWLGDISIANEWNGTLVLNNIVNFTGRFTTDQYHEDYTEEYTDSLWPSPLLTSIEAPQLRFLGVLSFMNASNIETVALPNLEKIGSLFVDQSEQKELVLDVTSLKIVTDKLQILGNVPKVSFPNLTEADSIFIASNRSLLARYSYYEGSGPFPGMAVDFPLLVHAGLVHLIGNISSIKMPWLMSSGGGYNQYDLIDKWSLKIWTTGNPLNVNFPFLRNVSDISLWGTVNSFYFPDLESMDGTFEFKPTINAFFQTWPLQYVGRIEVGGNVTDYNLDSLRTVDGLKIYPLEKIDCDPAVEAWLRMHPGYDMKDWYDARYYYDPYFDCNAKSRKKENPFPKVAVGLAVGIGIPVWLFFMFALWHSRKQKKKAEEVAKIKPPDYEAEMAARSAGGGEVLPDYEPRRSQGSGGHPESVIELVDMTRPSQRPQNPPGYDVAVGNGNAIVSTGGAAEETHNGRAIIDNEPRSTSAT
ncbi:hypothetical protein ONS95_010843 [Cadophora gregata]|uniref:uncharacterized protein n=1 Tax=Cadophora gregata TaxID=51156 RepID=UPI0026DB728D|nr:uncharacterized protein ONS95_010843 [Cadophora gregata]KAK0119391.1 hypothetical protein ONS95_010843 [Cadophora gregata]